MHNCLFLRSLHRPFSNVAVSEGRGFAAGILNWEDYNYPLVAITKQREKIKKFCTLSPSRSGPKFSAVFETTAGQNASEGAMSESTRSVESSSLTKIAKKTVSLPSNVG